MLILTKIRFWAKYKKQFTESPDYKKAMDDVIELCDDQMDKFLKGLEEQNVRT